MSIVNKYSAVAEMDDRLAATEMDRKLGWLCPFGGQTGQTDRQRDRQDNGPIATIRLTVLQTVAQKQKDGSKCRLVRG